MKFYFLGGPPVAFFLSEIHGPRTIMVPPADGEGEAVEVPNPDTQIPAAAIEISAEMHAALMEGQAAGMVIASDAAGFPTLVDRPPPSLEEAMVRLRAERDRRINLVAWRYERRAREIRLDLPVTDDDTALAALDAYIQALADLPEQPGLDPLNPEWPEEIT